MVIVCHKTCVSSPTFLLSQLHPFVNAVWPRLYIAVTCKLQKAVISCKIYSCHTKGRPAGEHRCWSCDPPGFPTATKPRFTAAAAGSDQGCSRGEGAAISCKQRFCICKQPFWQWKFAIVQKYKHAYTHRTYFN